MATPEQYLISIKESVHEFCVNLIKKLNDPNLHIDLNASKIHSYFYNHLDKYSSS